MRGARKSKKSPLGPKHSCKQRQINGFNDCEIVRCVEKPQSVTAHWLPRGDGRRPSHHLSQRSGQLAPPSEDFTSFSSLKQSLPLVLKCRK